MTLRYAVIADIVGSRTLTNRAEAQRIFEAALERAAEGLGLLEAPYPTVGDEFQAVAYSLEDALLLTLRAQLLLPPQLQLRLALVRVVSKSSLPVSIVRHRRILARVKEHPSRTGRRGGLRVRLSIARTMSRIPPTPLFARGL